MGRKRNMPSRKRIVSFWQDKLDGATYEDSCWKCGYDRGTMERAHIKAVIDGGSDDVSNLHLLCKNCHLDSEIYSGDAYYFWFCHDFMNHIDFQMSLGIAMLKKEINFLNENCELSIELNNKIDSIFKDYSDKVGDNKAFEFLKNTKPPRERENYLELKKYQE